MSVDFKQIGQRLKAHRLGSGLSPEDAADKLGVSRAALYNYERGSTPIKVETLERMADALGVSLPSLLGAGTEYFRSAVSYFERLRQLESESERISLFYEPISVLLTSEDFFPILKQMLLETLPAELVDDARSLSEIDMILSVLHQRRAIRTFGEPAIAGMIGLTEVKRLLRTGLVGSYDLPEHVRQERRRLAAHEVERLAQLLEREPLGLQIGVIDDAIPNQTFQICRLRNRTSMVAVSPFRLGEFPNVRLGVASITSAADAVELYEQVVAAMWTRAARGGEGAALLRQAASDAL